MRLQAGARALGLGPGDGNANATAALPEHNSTTTGNSTAANTTACPEGWSRVGDAYFSMADSERVEDCNVPWQLLQQVWFGVFVFALIGMFLTLWNAHMLALARGRLKWEQKAFIGASALTMMTTILLAWEKIDTARNYEGVLVGNSMLAGVCFAMAESGFLLVCLLYMKKLLDLSAHKEHLAVHVTAKLRCRKLFFVIGAASCCPITVTTVLLVAPVSGQQAENTFHQQLIGSMIFTVVIGLVLGPIFLQDVLGRLRHVLAQEGYGSSRAEIVNLTQNLKALQRFVRFVSVIWALFLLTVFLQPNSTSLHPYVLVAHVAVIAVIVFIVSIQYLAGTAALLCCCASGLALLRVAPVPDQSEMPTTRASQPDL